MTLEWYWRIVLDEVTRIVGETPIAARARSVSSPATELRATEALEYRAAKVRQRAYEDISEAVERRRSSALMR